MKKFISIALILTLIASMLVFASCTKEAPAEGDNTTDAVDNTETETQSDVDAEPVEKPVLKMGTNASFPPYEFYEDGKIVGIDAEIAEAIAEKLGYTLEIEDMQFDAIITSVTEGGVDMGMAGMTVTEERKKSVNFSTSYATGIQSVIVVDGSGIATLDDLAGKKIGVQEATTGDIYASDDYGEENVIKYKTGNDAVLALVGGDVDAVIIDNEPAKSYVAANADKNLVILDTEYAIEEYAIAIAKDNTEFLDNVNGAIDALIEDGTIDAIIEKYIPSK